MTSELLTPGERVTVWNKIGDLARRVARLEAVPPGSSVTDVQWRAVLIVGSATADAREVDGWQADNDTHKSRSVPMMVWTWQADSEIQVFAQNYDTVSHSFACTMWVQRLDNTTPSDREKLSGGSVVVAAGSFEYFSFTFTAFTALLDLTDPLIPTIIDEGTYAIQIDVARTG